MLLNNKNCLTYVFFHVIKGNEFNILKAVTKNGHNEKAFREPVAGANRYAKVLASHF